ncbi:hypothetical protein F2Q68_00024379 [Brassica cretica]|uniref:Uncharacterized protein n=1 Tax=Brassica cretica TaxID=69181 RepID=A0A8S9IIH1_BRACR|nr:hypothetical protein F2Q68_00024379 [Brassica cretica]
MFWSFRLGIMHSSSLFALHKAPDRATGATYDTRSRRNEDSVTSCIGVRHPLRAQPLVDNFLDVERPGGATSRTHAQFEDVKMAFRATFQMWSDLLERRHEPARDLET